MKSSSSRRNPRNAAIRTPDGLDQVYGVHALESLLERGEAPRELWVQQGAGNRLKDVVANAQASGARIKEQPREVLDQLTQGAAHQGVVAFCAPLKPEGEESLWLKLRAWQAPTPPLLLVLDGVTDVHNFGACLRSADAAGAHGVIVAKDKAAPLNATVRKVACGAAEVVPVYQVTNLSRTLAKLKDAGVWITGTAGEAEASVFEIDMTGPTALVMGAEGKGMRRLTREACDNLAKLPMAGQVSSLNVSVATGICLFEAVRQRQLAS
ncbi:23S rRNA (guanosine(2251)-2'-O)-methyltransferase RlmB [Halomonas meridiana]|uniref:23S rRNA (guanosine(2251)-2'-O)-methyltransferase RlmB n=1 Tax=Vreelandella aquamarina TaxID=77097 RepID=UPI001E5C41E4|nr:MULTISPECIES: 23S rRNA (guanosine(2251)-2'-O)-methyltransferase RlmB [Halomonas]MCD1652012.1 23S rRNA (guanosine(2251)-2'-O)-methyltransferase RlmB [Halomonas axialensis]MCD2088575.1 23S rRNA (guanosine(2251)-2'-O)-methyltransferase RlmB [Halomonas meridiana]